MARWYLQNATSLSTYFREYIFPPYSRRKARCARRDYRASSGTGDWRTAIYLIMCARTSGYRGRAKYLSQPIVSSEAHRRLLRSYAAYHAEPCSRPDSLPRRGPRPVTLFPINHGYTRISSTAQKGLEAIEELATTSPRLKARCHATLDGGHQRQFQTPCGSCSGSSSFAENWELAVTPVENHGFTGKRAGRRVKTDPQLLTESQAEELQCDI